MKNTKSTYTCTDCGGASPKWQGQCPHCSAWNSLVEGTATAPTNNRFQAWTGQDATVISLPNVKPESVARRSSSLCEFDRVLGGGLVPGAVILLGGDPGIGKSTLLLQVCAALAATETVLYVTGEESPAQVALRAERFKVAQSPLKLLAEIRLEAVAAAIERERPGLVVIDSIQTLYSGSITSAPGSVSQVRECAAALTRIAKSLGVTVVLVGHVTKEGAIAGPRVLEHIVDTVLYFEGDTHSSFRLVRAVKNRFGAANELGVFAMTETGLREVANPSALFLPRLGRRAPGTAVLATVEGTRPLLIEVQALVDDNHSGTPRRTTLGFDAQRLALLMAVLHRHCGVSTAGQDVFVNVVGGLSVEEPGADLAVACAVYSSLKNKVLPDKVAIAGEIGLGGEVRPVQRGADRVREADKLGFEAIVLPVQNVPKDSGSKIEVIPAPNLRAALEWLDGRG